MVFTILQETHKNQRLFHHHHIQYKENKTIISLQHKVVDGDMGT